MREKNYSLLLLAGGKSSRMGKDKAGLFYEGKTFADNLIQKAETLGIKNIYLSGLEKGGENIIYVRDIYSERGPLGGIHACMKIMETPYCLILPIDVPQIPVEILENLISHHEKRGFRAEAKELPLLLKHGERKEHLIAVYSVQMLPFIESLIIQNPVSVHSMLEHWGFECFETDVQEWKVANINTKENYEKLLSMSERGNEDVGKNYT